MESIPHNLSETIRKKSKIILIVIIVLFFLLTLSTKFYGATDISDYSGVAKFSAGLLNSKIRSSHSYLYGFLHAPFVKLTHSFLSFKISSLLFSTLIVYSVYLISNRNKKAFWLMLFSPVLWYMAPWISPIQLASLFFLWAYYHIRKFDKTERIRNLFYAGMFIGLGWAVWDTIVFFGALLLLPYVFNQKLKYSLLAILGIAAGMLPRFLLDQHLFGFSLFSTTKSFFGAFTNAFLLGHGSAYGSQLEGSLNFVLFILILVSLPLYTWNLYKKQQISTNKKFIVFITLSILLILINPQIRYTLVLAPIIISELCKIMDSTKFKKQIIFSIIIIIVFIVPHVIQITHSFNGSNGADITYVINKFGSNNLGTSFREDILRRDLNKIGSEFPREKILVTDTEDYYLYLATIYWGEEIEEFVSIQDYDLWDKNETTLFERRFEVIPKINSRRSIWIGGGINKNPNDITDYESIKFAISTKEKLTLEGFELVKKYDILYLHKKI